MSAITTPLPTAPDNFSTQIASATVSSSAITFNVDDASGLPQEGVGVLFKKDSSGDVVSGSIEFIHWTSVTGNTINLSDTGDRGLTGSDSGAQSYVADDYFEVWVSSYYYDSMYDAFPTGAVVGTTDTQTLTNKTLTSPTITTPTFQSVDGWVDANESWTYSAWDDTNGVSTATITVPSDATTKYQAGMRVKFTQPTDGVKYGIITKVTDATTLEVFMNTDYDFDNEAITSPFYSPMKAPFGFDLDPDKWKVEITDTANRSQGSPTSGTWYNINSQSIDIPIGAWFVTKKALAAITAGTNTLATIATTLSTGNSTESDAYWSDFSQTQSASGTRSHIAPHYRTKYLNLSTKDTYYLNTRTLTASMSSLNIRGDLGTTVLRAICAYL